MNLHGEHLTADDEHERLYGREREPIAAYCYGPGHLYEHDEDGVAQFLEPCPTCWPNVRNHFSHRYVGVNL